MDLTTAQLMEVVDTGAHVVWSPSSNMVLYGETAPIAEMLSLGIPVGLGPDWTVSGEDEMLSEMRFAYEYGQAESIDALTTRATLANGDGRKRGRGGVGGRTSAASRWEPAPMSRFSVAAAPIRTGRCSTAEQKTSESY